MAVMMEGKFSVEEKAKVSPDGFWVKKGASYRGKIKGRTIILMTTSEVKNFRL